MSDDINKYIIYGFFTRPNLLEITLLNMTKNIDFELTHVYSEENNFELIQTLESLPDNEWAVCIITKSPEKQNSIRLQLGILDIENIMGLEKFSSFDNPATGGKIFYGKLKELIKTPGPFLKKSENIGIAYISFKLLHKKLNDPRLSKILTSDYGSKVLLKLNSKRKKMMREVSKDVKSMVDRNRKETIIRFGTQEFDYTSLVGIKRLCASYGKNPEECTFEVNFNMENPREKEIVFTPNIDALELSGVKIIAKFFLIPDLDDETVYKLLFQIISRLPNIVSLDISFGALYGKRKRKLLDNSFQEYEVAKVLQNLRKLSVLRIFNVDISWISLFDCLKNIKTLKELILSNVKLVTSETQNYNEEYFILKLSEALTNVKTLGIKESCMIDNNIYAIDKILLVLREEIKLTTLDLSENELYEEPELFRGPFTNMLKSEKIKNLNLSYNQFAYEQETGEYDVQGFTDLCLVLRNLVNLETLKLSYTQMNLDGINVLIPTLKQLIHLKVLDISGNNNLYDEDITMLQMELPKVSIIFSLNDID